MSATRAFVYLILLTAALLGLTALVHAMPVSMIVPTAPAPLVVPVAPAPPIPDTPTLTATLQPRVVPARYVVPVP
jgi:hypothetical protein